MYPQPDPTAPGQESVWQFPRPAVARPCAAHVRIEHLGRVVLDTRRSVQTLETSHPPSYYVPQDDIDMALLRRAMGSSLCEWKGQARYYDVVIGDAVLAKVGWVYADPSPAFASIKDHIAFYAGPFERCTVAGEVVVPQSGGFYGGWITSTMAGPFKGGPGSRFW